jgi:hypothetical protein
MRRFASFTRPHLLLAAFAASAAIATTSLAGSPSSLVGRYVVVDSRVSADVATPGGRPSTENTDPIGQTIEIGDSSISMAGISCAQWQIEQIATPYYFENDPNLADLWLPPGRSASAAADHRLARSFAVACEDEPVTTIFQADARVLAMTWNNSASYLILEAPLTDSEFSLIGEQLVDRKFLAAARVDDRTEVMKALREWYIYRNSESVESIPLHPAITKNLLADFVPDEHAVIGDVYLNSRFSPQTPTDEMLWVETDFMMTCLVKPCANIEVRNQRGEVFRLNEIAFGTVDASDIDAVRRCKMAMRGTLVKGEAMRSSNGPEGEHYLHLDVVGVEPAPQDMCALARHAGSN